MASQGPNSADDFVSIPYTGSDFGWDNPSSAASQNDSYAVADGDGQDSEYLKATDFDFTIPTGAVINGIVVEVDRYASGDVDDSRIRIVKGGTIQSTDLSTSASWPSTDNDTYQSYGSSSNLWGTTWTAADINSTGFGVAIACIVDGYPIPGKPKVDHIRITVYYTEAISDTAEARESYTKLLLHCDGTDASTTFTDECDHTVTVYGNAQIDTEFYKFATASGMFDGTGDYLELTDSDDWYFGTGDFTIDFWYRPDDVTNDEIFAGQYVDATSRWWLRKYATNKLAMLFGSATGTQGQYTMTNASSMSNGTWYHIAFVRSSTVGYIFIDGVSQTLTENTAFSTNDVGNIGAALKICRLASSSTYDVDGHIDEFRISKGIARWTSNFTPPTAEHDLSCKLNLYLKAPTIIISHSVSATAIAGALTLNAPAVITVDLETYSDTAQALTLTAPAPSVVINQDDSVSPSALALTLTAGTPVCAIVIDDTVTPSALALTTALKSTIDETYTDPVVTAGCPLCGTLLYE